MRGGGVAAAGGKDVVKMGGQLAHVKKLILELTVASRPSQFTENKKYYRLNFYWGLIVYREPPVTGQLTPHFKVSKNFLLEFYM